MTPLFILMISESFGHPQAWDSGGSAQDRQVRDAVREWIRDRLSEWTGEALVHADGHEECGSGRGMERPAGVRPVHPGTSARLEFPGYIPCVPQHTAK